MADDDIDDIDFEKAFREFAETAGPGADGEADLLDEFDEKDEWELPDDGAERILVIKLGALGDFIQAMGPFKAIRNQHPDARLVLLTTAPSNPWPLIAAILTMSGLIRARLSKM